MARTVTSAESTLIAAGQGYSVRTKLWIKDSAGTYVDFSNLQSLDWQRKIRIYEDVDEPVATAEITLWRERYGLSLAPRMSTSQLNSTARAVDVGRRLYVEAAVTPTDGSPLTYRRIFEGYVDRVGWGGKDPVLTLRCRDLAGQVMDKYVEGDSSGIEKEYGSDAGIALETVIQSILTDNQSYGPDAVNWTLTTIGTTSKVLIKFLLKKQPTLAAIQGLAEESGWLVRLKWDDGTSSYKLTLFKPDRSKTAPDLTLGPDDWLDLSGAEEDLADVRNRIVLFYQSTANVRTQKIVEDATSKTTYGTRYMGITDDESSQIDTDPEATNMATAARDDLAWPKLQLGIERRWDPRVELYDLLRLTSDSLHFDENQDCGVVAMEHEFTQGTGRTRLFAFGDKTGGSAKLVTGQTFETWGEKEARPGVGDDQAASTDPAKAVAVAYRGTSVQSISASTWTTIVFNTETIDVAGRFSTIGGTYTPHISTGFSFYSAASIVRLLQLANGKTMKLRLFGDDGAGGGMVAETQITNNSGGAADMDLTISHTLFKASVDDPIGVQIFHDDTVSRNVDFGSGKTNIRIERLYNSRGQPV